MSRARAISGKWLRVKVGDFAKPMVRGTPDLVKLQYVHLHVVVIYPVCSACRVGHSNQSNQLNQFKQLSQFMFNQLHLQSSGAPAD